MGSFDGDKTAVDISLSPEARELLQAEGGTDACLVVLSGPRVGHHVVLSERVLEIGRGDRCGLRLDLPGVSRLHAHVEWVGDSHYLVDDGSTNGTYTEGRRVSRYRLQDGDRFEVGDALLKYLAQGNVEAAFHEELRKLATHDALTGIANKAHFTSALQEAVAKTRTAPRPVTLLVLDLDHFKRINDTWGHPAGDAVLRDATRLIARQLDPDQLFGRVGGEEFAILWAGADLAQGQALGERVRATIDEYEFVFEDQLLPVTTSVGVATRDSAGGESAERLFARADERLYTAKQSGRNRVA